MSNLTQNRIPKAKKMLVNSMLKLLEKKTFSKISVSDLCEEALVSRATFYVHFEDKYHLLKYSLEEEREKIFQSIDPENPEDITMKLIEYTQNNVSYLKHLIFSELNHEIVKVLDELHYKYIYLALEKKEKSGYHFEMDLKILAGYLAGGSIRLLLWWVSNDFPISKEKLCEILTQLAYQTTQNKKISSF